MVDLRPTVLRLQAHGVKVVIPAAGKPALHFKGFLADAVASYGSANWTRNSTTLSERVVVVSLSREAASVERAVFESYFEGSTEWDAALCSPQHR